MIPRIMARAFRQYLCRRPDLFDDDLGAGLFRDLRSRRSLQDPDGDQRPRLCVPNRRRPRPSIKRALSFRAHEPLFLGLTAKFRTHTIETGFRPLSASRIYPATTCADLWRVWL